MSEIRELLAEYNEDILFLSEEEYDDALVGIVRQFGRDSIACYSYTKIIEILSRDGMSEEEAAEFFEFNIIGSYVGENTPCFIETTKEIQTNWEN